MTPRAGDPAPDFALLDHGGKAVRLSDLRGRRVLLWFYAEDGTPACTATARGFRDAAADLRPLGVDVIVGVSGDACERHAAFRKEEKIPYALLSDPDHAVATRYGAWGKKMLYGREVTGVLRSTFLIDATGRIERAWTKVRAKGHVERVLADLQEATPVTAAKTAKPPKKTKKPAS